MPASIEMSNYYFTQISSFCWFNNVLCCINRWWHLPVAGDPVMTRSPWPRLRKIAKIFTAAEVTLLHFWWYLPEEEPRHNELHKQYWCKLQLSHWQQQN